MRLAYFTHLATSVTLAVAAFGSSVAPAAPPSIFRLPPNNGPRLPAPPPPPLPSPPRPNVSVFPTGPDSVGVHVEHRGRSVTVEGGPSGGSVTITTPIGGRK